MNKGLDLIKRQQPEFINDFPTGNISIGVTQEELIELEKELKALSVIKERLGIRLFEDITIIGEIYYCIEIGGVVSYVLKSKEQYDLLKEVLL